MFDREICGRSASREIYLYDEMHAEILGEKEKRMRKFQRTHKKDKTPAMRKRDRNNRLRKMYGLVWEDGWGWCWEQKSGPKKIPEYEADIIRNMRIINAEKFARADYEQEQQDEIRIADIADALIDLYNAEIYYNSVQDWTLTFQRIAYDAENAECAAYYDMSDAADLIDNLMRKF